MNRLNTIAETAKQLGVGRCVVRTLIKRGKLAVTKIDGLKRFRIPQWSIDEFAKQQPKPLDALNQWRASL